MRAFVAHFVVEMARTPIALLALVAVADAFAPSPHYATPSIISRSSAPMTMAAPPPPPSAFYRRPSAALERGGGFYVPGLEGTRLRVAAAVVLSVGLVLNRVLSPGEAASSQLVSEALGTFGCLLIFVQSAAQAKLEAELEADDLRAALAERLAERQEVDPILAKAPRREACARWAASALLRLTPARAVLLVAPSAEAAPPLLRFGRFPDRDAPPPMCRADDLLPLLPAGAQSIVLGEFPTGGEQSPHTPLPSNTASAALCRCGDSVIALTSERPFAFSPKHERWLVRCAALIEAA